MGIFNKRKEEEIPKLPELPRLPELNFERPEFNFSEEIGEVPKFPTMEEYSEQRMPKLPSFPTSYGGEKFSRNNIKNAVQGEDNLISNIDEEYKNYSEEDLDQEEIPKKNIPSLAESKVQEEKGPIFVRIDKFEDSLKYLKQSKEKLKEIQDLLSETKELKKKESLELAEWEENLGHLKSKLEKIEKEFSSKF